MLEHIDCVQGTSEWLEHKLGIFSASRAAAAMKRNAPKKAGTLGEFSAKRRNLATAIALERVTKRPAYDKPFQTDAMSRGNELEPAAKVAYTERTGIELCDTGFWRHSQLPVGVSYDGLTLDYSRGIECKVLYPNNHLDIALDVQQGKRWEAIPEIYQWQILHEMAWMPSLAIMDFVCYCPEFDGDAALVIIPVPRDEQALARYRDATLVFLDEVAEQERKVRSLKVA